MGQVVSFTEDVFVCVCLFVHMKELISFSRSASVLWKNICYSAIISWRTWDVIIKYNSSWSFLSSVFLCFLLPVIVLFFRVLHNLVMS